MIYAVQIHTPTRTFMDARPMPETEKGGRRVWGADDIAPPFEITETEDLSLTYPDDYEVSVKTSWGTMGVLASKISPFLVDSGQKQMLLDALKAECSTATLTSVLRTANPLSPFLAALDAKVK
jgi:hypothetical protein